MASPATLAPGRVRLLEPDDGCEMELRRRLTEGTYDKPFVVDCGPLRYLHFDLDNVQSVMRHDDPNALCLAYTRKMMSFLLFHTEPRHVLLLGLGGGSLAKFCYRHLPQARVTVVEIDRNVLALRDEFQIPPDDERFRVINADAVAYVAQRVPRADAILVDACDREGLAPALSAPDFYANLRRRLTLPGVLAMNVCGTLEQVESHLGRLQGIFGDRLIHLPAREDGNIIVLGFRTAPRSWDGAQLDLHARRIGNRFGLDFPRYVRSMVYGAAGRA